MNNTRNYNYRRKQKWKEQKRLKDFYESNMWCHARMKVCDDKEIYFKDYWYPYDRKFIKNQCNKLVRRSKNKDFVSNGANYKRAAEYWWNLY